MQGWNEIISEHEFHDCGQLALDSALIISVNKSMINTASTLDVNI